MHATVAQSPALVPSPYDPPALLAVKPAATNFFVPNFMTFPAGVSLGSVAKPIPPEAYGVSPAEWLKWPARLPAPNPKP
jgi:hypothetical protein